MELDFRRITVVSVTGLQPVASGALRSVIHSALQLPGSSAVLISPEKPAETPAWVRHVPIKPFGYLEYGIFVLYALHDFIETDFALVVQDDGWVLSGSNWKHEFLDFDYIGAPVHLARVSNPLETTYIHGFQWVPYLTQSNTHVDVIFNGGFSLRSRKFLGAPRKLGLKINVPPISILVGPPFEMRWEGDVLFEDVQLCTVMRHDLEQAGIRFAPLDLARQFSIEHVAPQLHENFNLLGLFGSHSKLRKLASLEPPTVNYIISNYEALQIFGEAEIARTLERFGFAVKWHNRDSLTTPNNFDGR